MLYAINGLSSRQLRDPGDAHIDFGNLVPGGIVCDPGLWKAEDALEFPHRLCRGRAVDAVCTQLREGRIGPGDDVQLLLQLAHLGSRGALLQIVARPGGGDAGDGLGCVDVHVVPVVVAEDLDGRIALVPQGLGSPLRQPFCKDI